MKKSELNLTEIFQAIATESQAEQFNVRLTATESAMLGMLARNYSLKKSEVMRRLLHQAVVDYVNDNEVMALLSYQYE